MDGGVQKRVWPFRSCWVSKIFCISRMNEMNWFFAHWYKFRKVKSYDWVDMVKNGQGLIDHGTLQLGVSDKWFNELSRLTERFVDADSDGRSNFWFYCQSTFYVWHLNAVEPLQLYLAAFFHKNSQQPKPKKKKKIKIDLETRFFHYFENFCNWFLLEVSFNKNLYCYLSYCTNPISGKILALQL